MKTIQVRQGDLLIETATTPMPENVKPRPMRDGRWVAAYGEVTGHAHTLNPDTCELYEDEKGTMWLRVKEGTTAALTHEEHDTQTFAPGLYTVTPQREYDAARDGERRVID